MSSLAAVGGRVWAGLHDGRISVWDAAPGVAPTLLGVWQAHGMCVIGLALAGTRVVSLGADGSVKAWAATSPCEQDADARCAYSSVDASGLWSLGCYMRVTLAESWGVGARTCDSLVVCYKMGTQSAWHKESL